jgi:hypothetical protein
MMVSGLARRAPSCLTLTAIGGKLDLFGKGDAMRFAYGKVR